MNLDTRLNLETYNILLTIGNALLNLLLRESKRVAHLTTGACVVLEVLYLGTLSLKLLRSIEGNVSLACFKQLLDILLVYSTALALAIWTMIAAE